jgi:hypothetical protein
MGEPRAPTVEEALTLVNSTTERRAHLLARVDVDFWLWNPARYETIVEPLDISEKHGPAACRRYWLDEEGGRGIRVDWSHEHTVLNANGDNCAADPAPLRLFEIELVIKRGPHIDDTTTALIVQQSVGLHEVRAPGWFFCQRSDEPPIEWLPHDTSVAQVLAYASERARHFMRLDE